MPRMSVSRIGSSLVASGETGPSATPPTWLTLALVTARAPPQTDPMLEEPQDAVMSDSARIEKAKSSVARDGRQQSALVNAQWSISRRPGAPTLEAGHAYCRADQRSSASSSSSAPFGVVVRPQVLEAHRVLDRRDAPQCGSFSVDGEALSDTLHEPRARSISVARAAAKVAPCRNTKVVRRAAGVAPGSTAAQPPPDHPGSGPRSRCAARGVEEAKRQVLQRLLAHRRRDCHPARRNGLRRSGTISSKRRVG